MRCPQCDGPTEATGGREEFAKILHFLRPEASSWRVCPRCGFDSSPNEDIRTFALREIVSMRDALADSPGKLPTPYQAFDDWAADFADAALHAHL